MILTCSYFTVFAQDPQDPKRSIAVMMKHGVCNLYWRYLRRVANILEVGMSA